MGHPRFVVVRKGGPPAEDLLNSEYSLIYKGRANGLTAAWWGRTVDRLGKWRAYRGPTPPNTRLDIDQRGQERLARIAVEYQRLRTQVTGEPSLPDLHWEDVFPLFAAISEIKPTSIVFASKLSHFILPKVFIPMDNLATDVWEYEFYWRGIKDEWNRFQAKEEAKSLIMAQAGGPERVHELYPFEAKILELSHIGYKHGKDLSRAKAQSAR